MVTVLGITSPRSVNSAAAVVVDGRLIAAAEEERFIGIKHAPNIPPVNAARFCLTQAGVTFDQLDHIAIGWGAPLSVPSLMARTITNDWKNYKFKIEGYVHDFAEDLINHIIGIRRFNSHFPDARRLRDRMVLVPHHLAHAASAFYVSGMDHAAALTIDGRGEWSSGGMWEGKDGVLRKLADLKITQSLGMFYAAVTGLLGFEENSEEGKTMGLAAYGKATSDFSDIIQGQGSSFHLLKGWDERIKAKYGPQRKKGEELSDSHKNLAASAQRKLEAIGLDLVREVVEKIGSRNVCLAGGVALNCEMNGKVMSEGIGDGIFIQPAAHDAGTAIGAAMHAAIQEGDKCSTVMEHAYWGPEYSDEHIENLLKSAKVPFERCDDPAGVAAERIAKGNIIGWFQGRMEIGPRALGNRSILADPSNPEMKKRVNDEVKHRELWRPFAPSILAEACDEYFEDYYKSPFMLLVFRVREGKLKYIASAAHVDGTARPQEVRREFNSVYHRLLKEFEKITAIPAVLNTSFNDKGQPIVMSPKQAMQMYFTTGLDALFMGRYLLNK